MSVAQSLNWLVVLTSGKRATIDAGYDPALNTLEAWTYYLQSSFMLLLVPIVGTFYWKRQGAGGGKEVSAFALALVWL